MSEKFEIIKEFMEFLKSNKKWWMVPVVLFLLALGAFVVVAEGSAIAPLIYTLF